MTTTTTTPTHIATLLAALDDPEPKEVISREEWERRHTAAAQDRRRIERRENAESDMRTIPEEFAWAIKDGWQGLLVQRCNLSVDRIKGALETTGDVLLRGPSGAGKTSLAVAIMRRRIEKGQRGRFVPTIDLRRAHADQVRDRESWKFVNDIVGKSLVLLDDIGFELAGGTAAAVCDMVYSRRGNSRTNIWTTAFSDEQLAQHYGDGTRRRLTESGRVTVVELGA